jgi:hypothetical protein
MRSCGIDSNESQRSSYEPGNDRHRRLDGLNAAFAPHARFASFRSYRDQYGQPTSSIVRGIGLPAYATYGA